MPGWGFTRVRAFSPSLRASGTKSREIPQQQPLHAISAGSPLLRYGCFLAIRDADTRSRAGMSALDLHQKFAKVGSVRGGGRYADYLRECRRTPRAGDVKTVRKCVNCSAKNRPLRNAFVAASPRDSRNASDTLTWRMSSQLQSASKFVVVPRSWAGIARRKFGRGPAHARRGRCWRNLVRCS
jgi:hypothetical protein